MLRTSRILICWLVGLVAIFAATPFLYADVVILLDGTQVKGRILGVDAKEVVMEVPYSETILEERRISRSEIREIQKNEPDLAAFKAIQEIPDLADALSPEDFDSLVGKMEGFIREYPYSREISKARARVQKLNAEKERSLAGEIKLDGEWLTPEQALGQSYELDSRREAQAMEKAAAQSNLIGALNHFIALEKNWPGSAIFPLVLKNAKTYLRQLDRLIEHEQRNQPVLEKERTDLIALASSEDQNNMNLAREREIERMKANIERSAASGEKFPPYLPVYSESMDNLRKIIAAERDRLNAIDLAALERSLAQTAKARQLWEEKEYAAAKEATEFALKDWPLNQRAISLQIKITDRIAELEEASRQASTEAAGDKKSQEEPTAVQE